MQTVTIWKRISKSTASKNLQALTRTAASNMLWGHKQTLFHTLHNTPQNPFPHKNNLIHPLPRKEFSQTVIIEITLLFSIICDDWIILLFFNSTWLLNNAFVFNNICIKQKTSIMLHHSSHQSHTRHSAIHRSAEQICKSSSSHPAASAVYCCSTTQTNTLTLLCSCWGLRTVFCQFLWSRISILPSAYRSARYTSQHASFIFRESIFVQPAYEAKRTHLSR